MGQPNRTCCWSVTRSSHEIVTGEASLIVSNGTDAYRPQIPCQSASENLRHQTVCVSFVGLCLCKSSKDDVIFLILSSHQFPLLFHVFLLALKEIHSKVINNPGARRTNPRMEGEFRRLRNARSLQMIYQVSHCDVTSSQRKKWNFSLAQVADRCAMRMRRLSPTPRDQITWDTQAFVGASLQNCWLL